MVILLPSSMFHSIRLFGPLSADTRGVEWSIMVAHLAVNHFYRPRSRGDDAFGSVRVFVCMYVCMYVTALLFEPFDLHS